MDHFEAKQKRPSPDFVPRSIPRLQPKVRERDQSGDKEARSVQPRLHLLLRQRERPGFEPVVLPKPQGGEPLSRSLPGLPVVEQFRDAVEGGPEEDGCIEGLKRRSPWAFFVRAYAIFLPLD